MSFSSLKPQNTGRGEFSPWAQTPPPRPGSQPEVAFGMTSWRGPGIRGGAQRPLPPARLRQQPFLSSRAPGDCQSAPACPSQNCTSTSALVPPLKATCSPETLRSSQRPEPSPAHSRELWGRSLGRCFNKSPRRCRWEPAAGKTLPAPARPPHSSTPGFPSCLWLRAPERPLRNASVCFPSLLPLPSRSAT